MFCISKSCSDQLKRDLSATQVGTTVTKAPAGNKIATPPTGDSFQHWTPLVTTLSLCSLVGVAYILLRPSTKSPDLIVSLSEDILHFLTRTNPSPRLVGPERIAFNELLERLLTKLSVTGNDLPILEEFIHTARGRLPDFKIAGRVIPRNPFNNDLQLVVESPEASWESLRKIRRMTLTIPMKGERCSLQLAEKKLDFSRFFPDERTSVDLVLTDPSGRLSVRQVPFRRSHLGLAGETNPAELYPRDSGYKFLNIDPPGLERWSPLLETGRWPKGLQLQGHLPRPMAHSDGLRAFKLREDYQIVSRRGEPLEAFFPVAQTSCTPWSEIRSRTSCGVLYRFNQGGRLERVSLVEMQVNGTRRPLLEIEYEGASWTAGQIQRGASHAVPNFSGEADRMIAQIQQLTGSVLGRSTPLPMERILRERWLPLLMREESTLPRRLQVVLSRDQGREQLLVLKGRYLERSGIWHLELTAEGIQAGRDKGKMTVVQSVVQIPIGKTTGHFHWSSLSQENSVQSVADTLRQFVLDTPAKEPVLFRQSALGDPKVRLRTFYTGRMEDPTAAVEGYNITALDDALLERWGELLDASPVRAMLTSRGRLPGLIRSSEEMDTLLHADGFRPEWHSMCEQDGRRIHSILLAETARVPWSSQKDPLRLLVRYEFETSGRFVRLSLSEFDQVLHPTGLSVEPAASFPTPALRTTWPRRRG